MNEDQINHMVTRFLQYRLPDDFSPDGGISFKRTVNENTDYSIHIDKPSGTNLLNYSQAKEMVKFMLEGLDK